MGEKQAEVTPAAADNVDTKKAAENKPAAGNTTTEAGAAPPAEADASKSSTPGSIFLCHSHASTHIGALLSFLSLPNSSLHFLAFCHC